MMGIARREAAVSIQLLLNSLPLFGRNDLEKIRQNDRNPFLLRTESAAGFLCPGFRFWSNVSGVTVCSLL